MKILITGIGGFVGKYLREHLERSGHEVYGFERSASNFPRVFKGDITDAASVLEAVEQVAPDWTFHLAGLSTVKACEDNPDLAREVNVGGTKNLLDAVRAVRPQSRVLIVTSAYVYGDQGSRVLTEDLVPNPRNVYAQTKLEQEQLAAEYQDLHMVLSRSFNHIGPGQLDGVVPTKASEIARIEAGGLEPVIHVKNPGAVRDFTDVRDMVTAYELLIRHGMSGEAYNLGSEEGIRIGDLVTMLVQLSATDIQVEFDQSHSVQSDTMIASTQKYRNLIGAPPGFLSLTLRIPLLQTLRDTLDYWRNKAKNA